MLCKLSLSNVKKSFKDYAVYFITLILGVCIFYIFNSMDSQTAMLKVTSNQSEMIELLISALSYVSVFVSFILGFLIIYASRFLIKKRNKEFGIYMLLGMSKRKISFILLIETFIIGLISLVVGLILGIFLSQITSIFVANMFEAEMSQFAFNFSQSAMIKTIIYFSIIYFIVMIFNTVMVNKTKLISLLQASKRGEKIKIKNTFVCIVLFIISIMLLGRAYYMVTGGVEELLSESVRALLVPVLLGIIGTVIFFYSVAGMILKIISKCHRVYFKNLNTFVSKQVSSKINTMVISISVICIMLFVTLCLLSSAFTIKNYFNASIRKYAPVDFEIVSYHGDEKKDQKLIEFVDDIKDDIKDVTIVHQYYDEGFNYEKSLGNNANNIKNKYPYLSLDSYVYIMPESEFNKLASVYHFDTVELKSDEYAIVSNFESGIYKDTIDSNSVISIYEKKLKPYNKIIDGFYEIGANLSNLGFFVVDDSIINKENKYNVMVVGNYKATNKDDIVNIENKIIDYTKTNSYSRDTKLDIKNAASGLSTIITFIGLFLGIIFLITSSAILALKELSDCLDDKNKYKVLRQIGADEKEINKALYKQTLIFFMTPLSLAIVHTIFGLKFCAWILKSIGITNIFRESMITLAFLIIIYGLYFIVTYLCSKNIIKEKL